MALRKVSASGQIYRGGAPPPTDISPSGSGGSIDQENVAIFKSEHEAAKSNRLFTALPAAGWRFYRGRRAQRLVWLGSSHYYRSCPDRPLEHPG